MVYTHTHIRMHTARRVPSTTSAPTKIFIARIKHVRTRNLVIISDVLTCVRVCAREREQVLAHFPRNKPTQNKTYTKSRPEFSHQIIPRDMRQTTLLLSFIYELFTPLSHTRPTRHMSRVCSPTAAAAAARSRTKVNLLLPDKRAFLRCMCVCVAVSVIVVLN